jgi:amidase
MAANIPLPTDAFSRPPTRWLRREGRACSSQRVRELARSLSQRVVDWFGDADVWLTPTIGPAAPRVGEHRDNAGDGEKEFRALAPLGAFTAPFNVSGQPAATLPWSKAPTGVPIGVQLVGRCGEDGRLLALSEQARAARPWEPCRE